MKPDIVIVTGDKVLRVPHDVWAAFLQVASLMVDTGDMYPHLEKHLGEQKIRNYLFQGYLAMKYSKGLKLILACHLLWSFGHEVQKQ